MKKALSLGIAFAAALMLAGCYETNYQQVDTVRKFDKAIIALPNGEVVSGRVEQWRDFEDGDQLQIKIGETWYLVHSTNCVLIKSEED